jgi:hypothetical protein
VPVLLLLAISRAPAQTATLLPDANDGPRFGVVAGEVGGAIVAGGVLGFGLGYAAVRATGGPHYDPSEASILPLIAGIGGLVVGHAAGSALGTWLVGSIAQQDHAASGAVLGALAGLPVSFVLVAVAMLGNVKSPVLLLIPAVAAPPAGAVIGYNLTPPCGCTGSRPTFGRRLLPPSIGLRREPGEATVVAYDVRLLNVRF